MEGKTQRADRGRLSAPRPRAVTTRNSSPSKAEEPPTPQHPDAKPSIPVQVKPAQQEAKAAKVEPPMAADVEEPETPAASSAWSEFSRGDPKSPKIAVTFDAGWENRPGAKILDVLAKHHVHSTFFLTGRWAEKNPDLTKRIFAEGHEIGNHTWSHKRLTKLSAAQIAEDADKTEQLIVKLTGKSTKPLLRVPYGTRDKRVVSILAKLGYRSIYWDEDCWDSVKPNVTSAEIEARVIAKTRNGSVILMHIGSEATANALDSIIEKLETAGFQPVTVGELLNS